MRWLAGPPADVGRAGSIPRKSRTKDFGLENPVSKWPSPLFTILTGLNWPITKTVIEHRVQEIGRAAGAKAMGIVSRWRNRAHCYRCTTAQGDSGLARDGGAPRAGGRRLSETKRIWKG
jgi:hypothetical protein